MKITITGSLGNIGKPLAETLIRNGHQLTVISSDQKKIKDIELLGATAAIGSVADADFLAAAFKGADAVYTMVPPNMNVSNYLQYVAEIGKSYAEAITNSGVKRVVNLSSIGAHLDKGNGPIAGLHQVEETLNRLDGVAIRHLRPGLFFSNFFFQIPAIRHKNIMGNNYSGQINVAIVHPKDIAEAAAEELQSPFDGKSHRYVVGDELKMNDAANILGAAIGKPDLSWHQFSDQETFTTMQANGMSEAIAKLYVEIGQAISTGILFTDFRQHRPEHSAPRKLVDFAKEFAAIYSTF
ncbi:NmrA family NAD(P)-binding protein [Chitinophaga vietnamensis]|uniref:NmrA family NAD(P)-binding protein n=1 Tax=Chitinophaga vietnamensis TaxID=2593957 RepID=UPI0011779820|nr:NmrA family NAD(P)-binding protein [Chitinophaga vietnamensis]